MKTWEYRTEVFQTPTQTIPKGFGRIRERAPRELADEYTEWLNALGAEGWEYIQEVASHNATSLETPNVLTVVATFKRAREA